MGNHVVPQKTNMAPENTSFQKEIPIGNYHCLRSMLVFKGSICLKKGSQLQLTLPQGAIV